jgi:hypothetical protein
VVSTKASTYFPRAPAIGGKVRPSATVRVPAGSSD